MPGAVTKKVLKLVAIILSKALLKLVRRFSDDGGLLEKNQPEGNSWFTNFSVLISHHPDRNFKICLAGKTLMLLLPHSMNIKMALWAKERYILHFSVPLVRGRVVDE